MIGYVEEGRVPSVAPRQMAGMWCLCGCLPDRGALRRWQRRNIWRQMQRHGVRRAVLPPELMDEAARWGIAPVEVYGLRRAQLPQLLAQFPSLRGKTVRLRAPFVTAEVAAAAELLAVQARYLDLQTGQGSAQLALHLQRRFGLAAGAVGQPALTVSFHRGEAADICLGEDCAVLQQVDYAVTGAEAVQEQLLAALFAGGYLEKVQIHVKSIRPNA